MYNLEQVFNSLSSECIIVQTPQELDSILKKIRSSTEVAIHIETTGHDFFSDGITAIWIATAINEPVILIQVDILPSNVRNRLQRLFGSASIDKIFFNAVSACTFIANNRFRAINGSKFDLLTAHNLLNSSHPKRDFGLTDLVEIYLGNRYESLFSEIGTDSRDVKDLNEMARCINMLLPLKEKLIDELDMNGLRDTFELESGCIDVACNLNMAGIMPNYRALRRDLKEIEKERHRYKKEAEFFFAEDLNIDGTTTLKQGLNNHPKIIAKDLVFSDTKRATLESIAHKLPGIQSILDYRAAKHKSNAITRVLESVNRETRRVHSLYNPLITATNGFSCVSPDLESIYISEDFSEYFDAEEGKTLIMGKYHELKLRIIAGLCSDSHMIDIYKNKSEFIKHTASTFYDKRPYKVTKLEMEFAGAMVYKFIFGNDSTELSDRELYFKNEFFDRYNELFQWKEKLIESDTNDIRSIGGRLKKWNRDYNSKRGILNAIVQGTVMDITKRALWKFFEKLDGEYAKVVGFLKNDILVEVNNEDIDLVKDDLSRAMVNAGKFYLNDVPVKVNIEVQNSWKHKFLSFR
ncbi:MAG: DNA polymerase [Deltaproteobacteria bacterium]|jgi:DNA polymerase-1|nr:DNA polymerase [Deltaproteobacteria bacterium]